MVCVRKKDVSLRLFIDFRKLNRKTPGQTTDTEGTGYFRWSWGSSMVHNFRCLQAYRQGEIMEGSRRLTALSGFGYRTGLQMHPVFSKVH